MGEATGIPGDGSREAGIDSKQAVFDALVSGRCRRILRATRGGPRTATDLASSLDIPVSTVYRKLDALVEAGLVAESTQIRDHGNHSVGYECVVDAISVEFETNSIDVQFSDSPPHSGPDGKPDA